MVVDKNLNYSSKIFWYLTLTYKVKYHFRQKININSISSNPPVNKVNSNADDVLNLNIT